MAAEKVMSYTVTWIAKDPGYAIVKLDLEPGYQGIANVDATNFSILIDMLRNESPVFWDDRYQALSTSAEPVGEGE